MQRFTDEELAKYDGKDGRPSYIAYAGLVYDVTHSFLWKGGRHQAMHVAGCDLSNALHEAPHGTDMLLRVPTIGEMTSRDDTAHGRTEQTPGT